MRAASTKDEGKPVARGRPRPIFQPLSRTGENPPYGILGEAMETSASFEARSAPLPYPTGNAARTDLCGGRSAMVVPTARVPSMFDNWRVKVPLTT
jgi:hypothetical protein